jgi:hypothetical protein
MRGSLHSVFEGFLDFRAAEGAADLNGPNGSAGQLRCSILGKHEDADEVDVHLFKL